MAEILAMEHNAIDRLGATAGMIARVWKRFHALSREDAGIVQLYCDMRLSFEQISEVYEQPEDEIRKVIMDFVTQFLVDNPQIQQCLSATTALDAASSAATRMWAESMLLGSQPAESRGALIRDAIGGIICVGIPPEPQDLCARIIANGTAQRLRSPVKLDERDFFLGMCRRAAGQGAEEQEADRAVRTSSKGSVSLTRGSEQIDVGFTVAREEGKAATYVITFEDLPNWAIPVEFGFIGPDRNGIPKDYSIEGGFERPQFQFDVGNDPEREIAFIERTNTFITFDCP